MLVARNISCDRERDPGPLGGHSCAPVPLVRQPPGARLSNPASLGAGVAELRGAGSCHSRAHFKPTVLF